jgi:hypothetical protein
MTIQTPASNGRTRSTVADQPSWVCRTRSPDWNGAAVAGSSAGIRVAFRE